MITARSPEQADSPRVPLRSIAPDSVTSAASRLKLPHLILCLSVLGIGAGAEWTRPISPIGTQQNTLLQYPPSPVGKFSGLRLIERSELQNPVGVTSAHASTLTQLPDGQLLVIWWAGSRESGPDVRLYSARQSNGQWSQASEIINRQTLGAQLGFGVRRIGNPVVWTAATGQVHLFVVATGLGGWAAGRLGGVTNCPSCFKRCGENLSRSAGSAALAVVQYECSGAQPPGCSSRQRMVAAGVF